ncbi:hypothetical protein SS1_21 [Cronobacter phage vB_CsaP_Ss1]|nr:hypothetical protein SS1_21 [Cronobacter phage vB_CsaP_Ss1]
MLQFLPMLLKGVGGAGGAAAGKAGGGLAEQFMGALGASGSPNQSNKQIGMQFANAGLQAPQIPTVPLMQDQNQQTIQRQAPQTFNPLLQMLLNGGK